MMLFVVSRLSVQTIIVLSEVGQWWRVTAQGALLDGGVDLGQSDKGT